MAIRGKAQDDPGQRIESLIAGLETRLCGVAVNVVARTGRVGWSAPTAAAEAALVVVIEPE
jgi:hypothetical protein